MPAAVNASEGLARVAELIAADATHLAVGANTTPATAGDSQLVAETNRMAKSTTYQPGTSFQIRGLFVNSNLPDTTEEVGLFLNAGSGPNSGDMLARVVASFDKDTSDLLVIFDVEVL